MTFRVWCLHRYLVHALHASDATRHERVSIKLFCRGKTTVYCTPPLREKDQILYELPTGLCPVGKLMTLSPAHEVRVRTAQQAWVVEGGLKGRYAHSPLAVFSSALPHPYLPPSTRRMGKPLPKEKKE
jgi:hypothetical protein